MRGKEEDSVGKGRLGSSSLESQTGEGLFKSLDKCLYSSELVLHDILKRQL